MGVRPRASITSTSSWPLRSMMAMCTSPAREKEDSQGRVRPRGRLAHSMQSADNAPALKGHKKDKNRMRWSCSPEANLKQLRNVLIGSLGWGGGDPPGPCLGNHQGKLGWEKGGGSVSLSGIASLGTDFCIRKTEEAVCSTDVFTFYTAAISYSPK